MRFKPKPKYVFLQRSSNGRERRGRGNALDENSESGVSLARDECKNLLTGLSNRSFGLRVVQFRKSSPVQLSSRDTLVTSTVDSMYHQQQQQ